MKQDFLLRAIELAEISTYQPSPNPKVACLIVKNNRLIAQGVHPQAGAPHAEVLALEKATESTVGADLYINLEPCSHYGRTPPCTHAIIQAGISRVFIAMQDPNPKVAGKGIQLLRAQGLTVEVGQHQERAYKLNRFYCHWIQRQQPYVIAKWAMSLDGRMITATHDNRAITGSESLVHAHTIRHQVDAILIGSNTANRDNPQLTTRLDSSHHSNHPIRIILSANGSVRDDLQLFSMPGKTQIFTTKKAPEAWIKRMRYLCKVVVLPIKNQSVNLQHLLDTLGGQQITSLLVEGGPTVLNQFLSQSLVQETHSYIAPCLISERQHKQYLMPLEPAGLGGDIFIQQQLGR